MKHLTVILGLIVILTAPPVSASVCEMTELDTINPGGSLSQIKISGTNAYVAAGNQGIARIDVIDPENLELISFTATQGLDAVDLIMSSLDNTMVVADGNAGIGFYTLDGVGNLSHITTLDLPERIISVAGMAGWYMAGGEGGTLYSVLFDGANASEEGSVAVGGPVLRIVQKLSLVYCALGDGGIALIDISNRESPQVASTLDLGGDVVGITASSSVLYCGVEGVGLVSVSTSESNMWPLGSLSLDEAPTDLIAWGGRIFMAAPGYGVLVADASLGDSMLLLGELPLSGAFRLGKTANTLYVGRGSTGISTVDATECAGGGQVTAYFIPASARSVGAENSFWVTDVAVANLTSTSAVANIAYLVKDQNNSTPLNETFALDPGQQIIVSDVFDELFGLDEGNGGLRITTSHPDIKSTSRTYNAAGAVGTYGQFIPAVEMNEALAPGIVGVLPQLQENDGFRTNIGLLNRTSLVVYVQVDYYNNNGGKAGTKRERLVPYEMTQFAVTRQTGSNFSGYATVKLTSCGPELTLQCPDPDDSIGSSDDRIFAYASVIDNDSGDPIYIMPQKLSSGFKTE